MASGSFNGSTANKYITPTIKWSSTTDISNNKSTVSASLYLTKSSASTSATSGTYNYTIKIGDSSVDGKVVVNLPANNTQVFIGSHSTTITHNDDGTKSLTISASGSISGTTLSSTSISGACVLDTIARKSTLSNCGTFTIGTETKMTITSASSSFTHTLAYQFGTSSGTLYTKITSLKPVWNPGSSLAKQIPNAKTGKGTLILTTYNGNTNIGSNSYTFTLNCTDSLKPSITDIKISDPQKYADTFGKYVQGQSTMKVFVTASGQEGATITKYNITVDGKTYTTNNITTPVLVNAGDNQNVKVTVTDSRGYTSDSKTATYNVFAYCKPSIDKFLAGRCVEKDGRYIYNESGTKGKVEGTIKYSSLGGKNKLTYSVKRGNSPVVNETVATEESTVFEKIDPNNLDGSTTYQYTLTLEDNITAISRTFTVGPCSALLDFRYTGQGIGIGQMSTRDGLEIGWDVHFNKYNTVTYPSNNNEKWMCRRNVEGEYEILYRGTHDITTSSQYGGLYYTSLTLTIPNEFKNLIQSLSPEGYYFEDENIMYSEANISSKTGLFNSHITSIDMNSIGLYISNSKNETVKGCIINIKIILDSLEMIFSFG